MMNDMNGATLPNLETFCQAAEASSFTAAAQTLGLTQAAVSQRIQALEKNLGVPLFRREGGRVLLTEAGQRLYRYAQQIIALHNEARQAISGQKTPVTGELILAASSVPGERLLPEVLSTFRTRYPHIQVKAGVSDSVAVLDSVEHGQAHLGLVGRKDERPHLEFRSIACDKMVLVVPAGHAWVERRRVSLKELFEAPLILREPGSGSRWCLEQGIAAAGKSAKDLNVALELGSNEAIKDAVRRGMGLAVLSTQSIEKEEREGTLHGLAVSGLSLARELFVIWDRRRVLPIPARLFLDLLGCCSEQSAT